LLVFMGSAPARADIFWPIPDPNLAALFAEGSGAFDSATGHITFSGPVTAVQFPGEVISLTDPLILAGAVLTVDEFFTGKSLTDLGSLDKNGLLVASSSQITVGGKVVYDETVREFAYKTTYTLSNGFSDVDYQSITPVTRTIDTSVVHSPFLDLLASLAIPSGTTTQTLVYDKDGFLVPGARNDDTQTVPEPGPFRLLMIGLAMVLPFAARGQRRHRSSSTVGR
jgi:hypothetical protein